MAKSMNYVMLIGNIGTEIKLTHFETSTGKGSVSSFSMATSETYNNEQGEKVEKTKWHNIVVYGKMAENVKKYMQKGSKIGVQGKIRTINYESEGVKKYITEIVSEDVLFLSSQKSNDQMASEPISDQLQVQKEEDDDLPF